MTPNVETAFIQFLRLAADLVDRQGLAYSDVRDALTEAHYALTGIPPVLENNNNRNDSNYL